MNHQKRSKSEKIANAMLPMTISISILGCGGLIEYPLGNTHMVLSIAYSTICALTYFSTLFFSEYNENKVVSTNSDTKHLDLNDIFFQVSLFLHGISTFFMIIMGWYRKRGLQLFMARMRRADILLQKLGISNDYEKFYRRQLYIITFVVSINMSIIISNWCSASIFMCSKCSLHLKILFTIKSCYPMFLISFNDSNFINLMWCLNRKFKQLNGVLENLSETSTSFPQYMKLIYSKTGMNEAPSDRLGRKTNDDMNIMRISKQAHLDLMKIGRFVNQIFGSHLLTSLTLASVTIIFLCYISYIENMNVTKASKIDRLVESCIYISYLTMKIYCVNNICHKTSNEALRTGSIINELHEPETEEEFREEIRQFTLQLIQNPLKFTACGFFDLGNGFIQKVCGTVTTYLIILIQLQDIK